MSKHTHNSNAAHQASGLVRVCVGTLLASLLSVAVPAHALGPDREPQRREERDSRDVRDARDARDAIRDHAQRERDARAFERAEERRRAVHEAGNADMSRRVDRMTPDERRDLRRQINEAGQEIYIRPQRR